MLTVYKASAGSGKTFQLVVEYLSLLLKNPERQNYRHILAVTFTNKATNEMKTRILETLNELAQNKPSKYISILQQNIQLPEEIIRRNAQKVLKNILHDYNRFSISTIDSFTQRTIKSFNRELGINPNYRLELDSEMILAEATDRLLAKIDHDEDLLEWLQIFSKEKIEDNYSQRIEEDIKSLGKELFKENFQLFFPDESESVYSRKNLDEFSKELNKIKAVFENTLKSLGKKGVAIIEESGLTIDDFSGKDKGAGSLFSKYESGYIKEITATASNAAVNIEKWFTKTSPKRTEIQTLASSQLQPLLVEIIDFIQKNETWYYTSDAILKQLRILGILTDLKEEIKQLLHEKGVLQLSDSNLLLNKIIGQSDSPFIYEKTGSYYNHFMLDEFQDTSGLQWNNFKPLITNSLAEGNKNLLVGDVKQSVYRWRNSDYRILAEQINSDFNPGQIDEKSLEKNWRSDKNIIDFNNNVFGKLKTIFEEKLENTFEESAQIYIERFKKIYSSIVQTHGNEKAEQKGFVQIRFFEEETFKENSALQLIEQVKQLQDKGIKASETAILIRKNKEGAPIIETFLAAARLEENKKYNLSVLSNEALFLCASQGVLMVTETINLIINPDNLISRTALLNQWLNWLKPELVKRNVFVEEVPQNGDAFGNESTQLFETELLPKINQIRKKILLTSLDEAVIQICSVYNLFEIESELPFIQTLIDKAGELKSSLSNDLSNLLYWWNENGMLTSVSVNEELDSIRLLTVHKSKGLEFKTVLIPFFDWKITRSAQQAPILWCKPSTEPFNRFPLLPVKWGPALKKSIFREDYYEEAASNFIDIFNLVYVAFTRAKSVLIVHCPKPKESKSNSETSIKPLQNMLEQALENMVSNEVFKACMNEDKSVFQFGALTGSQNETGNINSVIIDKYHFNDFSERVKLRDSGENFLISDGKTGSVKNRGKIIHEILSSVVTSDDVGNACLKALNNGKTDEKERIEIQNSILESLKNPLISDWFSGKYTILNERSLLTKEKLIRPDRIMIYNDEAVVVDYKTGDKKSENYNRQVTRYANVLKKTGFKKVTGYLWYINQNEVEQVCEM